MEIKIVGYEGSQFNGGDLVFKIVNEGQWEDIDQAEKENVKEIYDSIKQWILNNIENDEELRETLIDNYDEKNINKLKEMVLDSDGEWSFTLV